MVDFSKLKLTKTPYVTYRCAQCGVEEEYVQEMPAGWRHYPPVGKCGGLLVETSRREVAWERVSPLGKP